MQPNFQKVVAMDPFLAYSIPIQGLKEGIHQFKFTLDRAFFRHFEDSPIEDGRIDVVLQLDKRADMLVLDFEFAGYCNAECARCTADIQLPIKGERQLVVKYGEMEDADEDEDEMAFISRDAPALKVAPYLYEFAILAMPISNSYNCEEDENPPCDFEILKYLENNAREGKSNPVWDALKGLK